MNTIDVTINGKLHQFPEGYLPTWPEAQHIIKNTAARNEDDHYVIRIDNHLWEEDADGDWWLDNMSRILAIELFNNKVSQSRLAAIGETKTYVPTETISLQVLRTPRIWAHFKPFFDLYTGEGRVRINGREYQLPAGDNPEANDARRKALFHALTGRRR